MILPFFFGRILPALLALDNVHRGLLWGQMREQYPVLLRICYHLGIKVRGARLRFWSVFFQVLRRNPQAVAAFGHDAYHFYRLREHAAYVSNQLKTYLAAAAPDDVLDEVIAEAQTAAVSGSR